MSARLKRASGDRGAAPAGRGRWAWATLVAGSALAVYLNALPGGFVYDDFDNVLRNPWVREPGRLPEAFTHHAVAFAPGYDASYYRPLVHVLLAASHRAFGPDPWAHHLLLALLHAACSAAVFALLLRFTRGNAGEGGQGGPPWGALAGGLLFAVHPIHVEAVAWVSGVMDVSYSLLVLLALLAATSRRDRARLVAAPALFLAALLAKEPAAMLLPAFAISSIAAGDAGDPERRRRFIRVLTGLGLALAVYLGLRVAALGGLVAPGGAERVHAGLLPRALTALALIGEYLGLLILPLRHTVVRDFPVATSLADVRVWLGAGACLAVGALGWRLRRNQGAVLGLSLLVLPVLPALYLPALGEGLVGERYLYLPSAGLALLVALAWDAWAARAGEERRPRCWAVAAAALVVAAGAAVTVSRNRVWRDDLSLWANAARNAPRNPAAHGGLGFALLARGRPAEAVPSLTRALELDPRRRDVRTNLASALMALGRLEEATEQARTVLAEAPRQAEAHAILGWALAAQGRLPEAAIEYGRAVELDPRVGSFRNGLGVVLARLGELASAEAQFREAIRLEPWRTDYRENLRTLERQARAAAAGGPR